MKKPCEMKNLTAASMMVGGKSSFGRGSKLARTGGSSSSIGFEDFSESFGQL